MITLSSRQREELVQISTEVRLPARTIIYREDAAAEWIYAVAVGTVKSYRDLPSGRRALAIFLFVNDLFGLAENGRYVNTTEAVVPVTLCRFSLSELMGLLQQDAALQFRFLEKVTHELRESQRRAILINRRDATGRLAMFVALMAARTRQAGQPEGDVPLPMSRSDIADFIGLSLESVSRASADLERRGLVKFESRHRARILDRAEFDKLVAAV